MTLAQAVGRRRILLFGPLALVAGFALAVLEHRILLGPMDWLKLAGLVLFGVVGHLALRRLDARSVPQLIAPPALVLIAYAIESDGRLTLAALLLSSIMGVLALAVWMVRHSVGQEPMLNAWRLLIAATLLVWLGAITGALPASALWMAAAPVLGWRAIRQWAHPEEAYGLFVWALLLGSLMPVQALLLDVAFLQIAGS